MSRASSSSLKRKIKRNSKKRNIKLRKIDKRERKMLVSKHSITDSNLCLFWKYRFNWNWYSKNHKSSKKLELIQFT